MGYAALLFFAKDGVRNWITKYNHPSLTESMQATKPWIEKTREFFGLLIIIGALLINYFVSKGLLFKAIATFLHFRHGCTSLPTRNLAWFGGLQG